MTKQMNPKKKKRAKPVSFYPLTPERAIADIFKMDAKKVLKAEKRIERRKK